MNILQAIKRGLKTTDKLLMSLCLLTSLFGVLMVYSATYSSLEDGSLISRTTLVMLLAVIVGVAMCIVISFIDYEIVLRFWMIIGGVCLLMMLLLFPFGSGTADRPDARTWFDFKVINFQPSELFKIAFIITFAVHLDYVGEDINKLKNALLLCIHGGVPALLVILTGDLGSALVFVSIFIGMMFASGLAARYFAAAGAVILAAVPVLWFAFFSDFQKGRILAVYAPSKLDTALYKKYIFQQQQSVNAIGSGRFFGRGFLKGAYTPVAPSPRQRQRYDILRYRRRTRICRRFCGACACSADNCQDSTCRQTGQHKYGFARLLRHCGNDRLTGYHEHRNVFETPPLHRYHSAVFQLRRLIKPLHIYRDRTRHEHLQVQSTR